MSFNIKSYDNVKFTSIGENKENEWSHDCIRIATNDMFAQVSAKKLIKLFKERAVASIVKKYTHLDNLNVVVPENLDVLTPEQKRKSLRAVNLVKEKGFGKIKGRTCDDGSTHRGYIPRE